MRTIVMIMIVGMCCPAFSMSRLPWHPSANYRRAVKMCGEAGKYYHLYVIEAGRTGLGKNHGFADYSLVYYGKKKYLLIRNKLMYTIGTGEKNVDCAVYTEIRPYLENLNYRQAWKLMKADGVPEKIAKRILEGRAFDGE